MFKILSAGVYSRGQQLATKKCWQRSACRSRPEQSYNFLPLAGCRRCLFLQLRQRFVPGPIRWDRRLPAHECRVTACLLTDANFFQTSTRAIKLRYESLAKPEHSCCHTYLLPDVIAQPFPVPPYVGSLHHADWYTHRYAGRLSAPSHLFLADATMAIFRWSSA